MRSLSFATSFFVLALAAAAQAQTPDEPEPLGHKHLVAAHAALPRADFGGPPPRAWEAVAAFRAPTMPIVNRIVMGYLPYWSYTAADPYVPARWDLLTHLAWFGAEMSQTGTTTNKHGWGGATTAALVQDAHAHGVKVIITITNFKSTQIASIVGSVANRARAIDSCLALLDEHGADGINIDFEFVPKAAKADFVTFMTELTNAVRAAQPNGENGHVSLAGPAVDWSGAYDYDQLLLNSDGIMIMAYGYHWTGGNPGPIATLFSGDLWGLHSIEWTIRDYFDFGGIENRGRVILGLPWYGNAWPVANRDVPGTQLDDGSAVTYKAGIAQMTQNGREWEPVSKSSYFHRTVGGQLEQVWLDDGEAFQARVAYADEMDIGGIGIWALGYEGEHPDFWDAIEAELTSGIVDPPEAGPEIAPETTTELGPEPGPEPTPEPVPDTTATTSRPDVSSTTSTQPETSGVNGAVALDPLRSVSADITEEGGGCSGSSNPMTPLLSLAVLILSSVRVRGVTAVRGACSEPPRV